MAISILAGPKFIEFLRRKEFGQHIREEGPAGHHVKQGTPTMGGLLIVFSMIIPFLALSKYTQAGLTVFFVTLACGGIGFIDDWFKVRHRRSLGLNGPLEASAPRGDHGRRRLVCPRHRALEGRVRAGPRLAHRRSPSASTFCSSS